jgi:glycerol-3-phosphate acyltransferase PlsX
MLAQFGLMGQIYSRLVLKVKHPRVGLLSIGEEEHKGNELTRDATPLLKGMGFHFIGNVEGRDLFSGHADVIVCDGFVGNVALKVAEGLAEMMGRLLKESLTATISGKMGYMLSRSAFKDFKKRTDYTEIGGAPLLGVKGVCIICHGRSDANAIKNAIRVAAEFASSNMNQRIEEELREFARVG